MIQAERLIQQLREAVERRVRHQCDSRAYQRGHALQDAKVERASAREDEIASKLTKLVEKLAGRDKT